MQQLSLFDYASLDADTRLFVQEKAKAIQARLKRTAEDIIAIGQDLIEVKESLGHGQFLPWLRVEFEMDQKTAWRFMESARKFGDKLGNLPNLRPSALYELLSAPDTVIEMVETAQIPATLPAIRDAKRELQQPQEEVEEDEGQAFKARRRALEAEGFYYIPEQKRVFDAIDAGIIEIDLEEDEEDDEEPIQENLTPEQFIDEVFPGLRQEQPRIVRPLTSLDDIFPDITQVQQVPESWKLPPEMPSSTPVADAKEKRDTHVMRVMGSSDSPEWYTPQDIIDRVCQMFGEIDTDPCSNSRESPAVPARILYTKEDDGLTHPWTGKTYLNPPYGAEISVWTDKLIAEYKRGNVEEALALLPGRIDTVWFSPLYEFLMCNVRGRLQFANSPYNAPFPCVIVYLGTRIADFIEVFQVLGPIMRRIG